MEKNVVYVVTTDFKTDSGESGIYSAVFSTFEKATQYFAKELKANENDFDIANADTEYYEKEFDNEREICSVECAVADTFDYFKITVDKHIVDSE